MWSNLQRYARLASVLALLHLLLPACRETRATDRRTSRPNSTSTVIPAPSNSTATVAPPLTVTCSEHSSGNVASLASDFSSLQVPQSPDGGNRRDPELAVHGDRIYLTWSDFTTRKDGAIVLRIVDCESNGQGS